MPIARRDIPGVLADATAPSFLACALLLGGASAAGIVANAALQMLALAIIAGIVWHRALPRLPRAAVALLALLALAAALISAQLIPLPEGIWSGLPGRQPVLHGLELAGTGPVWLPLSLTPDSTIASLLALLPPTAMILSLFAASRRGRAVAILVLVAGAVLSLLVGLMQIAGDPHSPLYFYTITNRRSAVGFFANRNHLATLLLCAVPFLTIPAPRASGDEPPRRGTRSLRIGIAAVLGCGVLLVGSVAGIALLIPVLAASAILALRIGRGRDRRIRDLALIAATICVLIAAATAAARFKGGAASDAAQHRTVIVPTTLGAAAGYMPFGTGGGSFAHVYPAFEDAAAVTPEYINHAHCDYAEIALEYGVPGLALVLLALCLWGSRVGAVWRLEGVGGAQARAGFVALAVIILASAADYPLRTATLATVAAMMAALVAAPDAPRGKTPRQPRDAARPQRASLSVTSDQI